MKLRNNGVDFGELGYATMVEVRDTEAAKAIVGLRLRAYADGLQPEMLQLASGIQRKRNQANALDAQLYQRPLPVSDTLMIARSVALKFLIALGLIGLVAALAGNAATVHAMWSSLPLTVIGCIVLTGAVLLAGHLAFERVLIDRPWLQVAAAITILVLTFYGVAQFNEARGLVTNAMLGGSASTRSYVDSSYVEPSAPEPPAEQGGTSMQQRVSGLLTSAVVKISIASDLALGFLVALIAAIRHSPDYAGWSTLRRLTLDIPTLERRRNELGAAIESAQRNAMAGILRARAFERAVPVPYLRVLPVVLLCVLAAPAWAQNSPRREEVILLDASASVANRAQAGSTFRQYIQSIRQLLATEPPESRVSVMLITTDSFGGGGSQILVKGWTPSARGVFTDDLDRARQQLVAEFDKRVRGLAPIASATDITGALFRATALDSLDQGRVKELYIFSDMINTAGLNMPALLPTGPEKMLEIAKANGQIAPLGRYRVHVHGAVTHSLTPAGWSAIRAFWRLYVREAGAELVVYSPDAVMRRE